MTTSQDKAGRKFSWKHAAGLVITGALLWFVFRKIPFGSLWTTLKNTDPLWFLVGFLVYGMAMWSGACRWHMALHLTYQALHLLATFRLFLVGHFLYTVLFGAVGGELAKTAVYARWFRFRMPEVLAASPLDRILGMGGTVVYAMTAFLITYYNNGFAVLRQWEMRLPSGWMVAAGALLAAFILSLIFWRPKGESALARAVRAFKTGGSRVIVKPIFILAGTGFGIVGQMGLTSVMGFNLLAVTQHDLPWGQMAWTFPAIMLVSAMPFTVAGAGAREMAALTFLGLYGVPPEECIAAALLTLLHKLVWALVGGIIFWRNGAFYARYRNQPEPKTISVVLPALNDAGVITETVSRIQANPEVREIIVVDGGSHDRTRELAAELGCVVVCAPPRRGAQLRAGAERASSDVVLLLRMETLLSRYAGLAALNCLRDQYVVGGGYWKKYEEAPLSLVGTRLFCALRLILARRVALGQGLFVRRSALEEVGGVPDVAELEDVELCRRLRKKGHLALADALVVGSAREYRELGVLRSFWRMMALRWQWWFRKSPRGVG